ESLAVVTPGAGTDPTAGVRAGLAQTTRPAGAGRTRARRARRLDEPRGPGRAAIDGRPGPRAPGWGGGPHRRSLAVAVDGPVPDRRRPDGGAGCGLGGVLVPARPVLEPRGGAH